MTVLALHHRLTSDARIAPRVEAAAWAVACSALFFFVYGGTNWLAAQRFGLPALHFAWERHVPFVPWMIVPYWSIDLLFAGSFFLFGRDRAGLRRHARRIVLTIAIAGTCFALFPLEMGFDRPVVQGVWQPLYATLHAFDRPHNLVPSLHVALVVVLLAAYDRAASRRWLRWSLRAWFGTIAVSTLLTHQHHLIDVITGFALGVFVLWGVPDPFTRTEPARNPRIAGRYALVTLALLALAWPARPLGFLLLWPAAACGVLCSAYLGLGAAVFRKRNGRLPRSTILLLAPYLLGANLSHRFFARRRPAHVCVGPNIFIGRRLAAREARRLREEPGVIAVLDLTAEYSECEPLLALPYRNIPLLDFTAPTDWQLAGASEFVRRHAGRGPVFIHCALGVSRSAAVAAACLGGSDPSAAAKGCSDLAT